MYPMLGQATPQVRQWLADEFAGRDADADRVFKAVFAEIRHPEPPAGLAERVVARLGLQPVARDPGRRGWTYVLASTTVGVLGVLLVGYGVVLVAPFLARQSLGLLNLSVRGVVWFVQALDSGLDVWTILSGAGRAIGAAVAQPSVMLSLVGFEFASIVALYGLHRLMRLEKE